MIRADATLNAAGFIGGLKSIDGNIQGLIGKFTALQASFAGFAAVIALFAKLKGTLDLGGELADMSANTGQSVSDLMLLRQMFDNAGVGADKVQSVFGKFQSKLAGMEDETGSAGQALADLKLSADELKGMSAVQQMEALSKGLKNVTDQGRKAEILQNLFGKGVGIKMGALLGDPEAMATASKQLGNLPAIMERMAPIFDQISDAFGAMAIKVEQFAAGLMEFVGPAIKEAIGGLSEIDLSGIGRFVGFIIAAFIKLATILTPVFWLLKGIVGLFNAIGPEYETASKSASAGGFAEESGGGKTAPVSALARVGGGGGLGFGDPALTEAKRQTTILEDIRRNTTPGVPPTSGGEPPPV